MDKPEAAAAIRTTCPYCGVGCGVVATPAADGSGVSIAGDPDHPANRGRLCSKGSALGETLGLDGRLLVPQIGGQPATWNAALDLVAARLRSTIAEHGPDSVAFYVSGQFLTEDYYVANKLMKGFIGSANIDTNSRLCMAASVAGHRRAFGADVVPGTYEDIEEADLVVLVGSNLAWCHPVLHQRLVAARARRGSRLVVVDPRRTATADEADLHLPVVRDGDVALFLGLLAHLEAEGLRDRAYVEDHVSGLAGALDAARAASPSWVAAETGLATADIEAFYALWAGTQKVVTVYSQGVNQSAAGTDKVNAILNCHLLTGRIGKPGMGPFSVTGQPNAMGGREVGGLATMLAAHMELESATDREALARFWTSPGVAARPGLKAVDLFDAVAEGRVRAIWIMGTNPVVSMPEAERVRAALAACAFVVVSEVEACTDTTPYAHVLLPALAWGEKSGTVTNSERRISRQRAFLPAPGEARPDWWIMAEVGRRMGYGPAFAYGSPAEIFREHAALSGHANQGRRAFDISDLAAVEDRAYEELEPFRWPQPASGAGRDRFFGDGAFFTPDRRARMVAVRSPVTPLPGPGRLLLNTGRIRDQWHTMTRTGRSARLMGQYAEPFCALHPSDAAARGIAPASLVTLRSGKTTAILRALVTERQPQGSIFVPMHWTGRASSAGRVNGLVSGVTDPVSGQPALKGSAVEVGRFEAGWYGFAVTIARPSPNAAEYWAVARAEGGWRLELAGRERPGDLHAFASALFGPAAEGAEWAALRDEDRGLHRVAAFAKGRLVGALLVDREPVAASRGFLLGHLGRDVEGRGRLRLLAGRGDQGHEDPGALVCACEGVGASAIAAAARAGATDVAAVGAVLGAGTQCGSCRSEIRRIIDAERLAQAG